MKRTCNTFAICLILIAAAFGCNKDKDGLSDSERKNYIAKLNGDHEWIGTGSVTGGLPSSGQVFTSFPVKVIDDFLILGFTGDSLKYKGTDTKSKTISFGNSGSQPSPYGYPASAYSETLTYFYQDDIIKDDYNYYDKYTGYKQNVSSYKRNFDFSLSNAKTSIEGPKVWSGTVLDWFGPRNMQDSNYSITDTFELKVIDDRTISCNKNFVFISDTPIYYHYLSTDAKTKIVTYQAYHNFQQVSKTKTISYNPSNKQLSMEQFYTDIATKRVAKLNTQ